MSENALALITGVSAPFRSPRRRLTARVRSTSSEAPLSLLLLPPAQLVVTVTGFQLYKDANEFYFSQECAVAASAAAARASSPAPPCSCRRCDGAGKMTCSKCRGYGYLKKGPDDTCARPTRFLPRRRRRLAAAEAALVSRWRFLHSCALQLTRIRTA